MACWNSALPTPTIDSAKVNPAGVLVTGKNPIPKAVPIRTQP
jgi:hypothetical protein